MTTALDATPLFALNTELIHIILQNNVSTRGVTVLSKKSNRTVLHPRFDKHLHRGWT